MALVKGYNAVRERYAQLAKQKKEGRIAPFKRAPGTGLPKVYGSIEDKEEVRHQAGLGKRKPTGGPAPQYLGKGRAMTTSEKKFYAKIKQEDAEKEMKTGTRSEIKAKYEAARKEKKSEKSSSSSSDPRRQEMEQFRKSRSEATTTIRKPGQGVYTARAATAEDLDKRGNLPSRTLAQKQRYAQFRKG